MGDKMRSDQVQSCTSSGKFDWSAAGSFMTNLVEVAAPAVTSFISMLTQDDVRQVEPQVIKQCGSTGNDCGDIGIEVINLMTETQKEQIKPELNGEQQTLLQKLETCKSGKWDNSEKCIVEDNTYQQYDMDRLISKVEQWKEPQVSSYFQSWTCSGT